MEQKDLNFLLYQAQQGNKRARDNLIDQYKPFIAKVASEQCRRYLDWSNDDELSIALIAFNKAIDKFDSSQTGSFISFAGTVIKNQLIDYFRKEGRHQHLLLSSISEEQDYLPGEKEEAEQLYQQEALRERRAEELMKFQQSLKAYNISLEELTKSSPKHLDTKTNLYSIALAICNNKILLSQLKKKKQLPIKDLQKATGFSRKVIETGRRYIIALVIILNEELYHIRSFIQFTELEKKVHINE